MELNAQSVIAEAQTTLSTSGLSAAQNVFKSAILDWVDDVTMGDVDMEGGASIGGVKEEVAKLWLGYASLNRGANLFKSATEVYEQAIHCPVAGGVGKIWLEYSKFLEERGRPRTAQNIYIRALMGDKDGGVGPYVTNVEDQNLLWKEFLRMIQTTKNNPNLTLDELKSTVQQEWGRPPLGSIGGDGSIAPATATSDADLAADTRPAKRSRWNKKEPEETVTITPNSIDTAANVLFTASKNLPPDIETLWHARDGVSPPTPPEPPLFSASPPKLGDASGKDLVGNEAALSLLKMMVAKTADGKNLGSALLDLCEACWMMMALKEDEVAKSVAKLEEKIIADTEALEANLEARASVAGAAIKAVQQANEYERNQYLAQASIRREQLQASIAWDFRKLLYTQQILLSSAKLPGFDGPTVDSFAIAYQSKVCSVMHSAFYLRARVGEASHTTMLNKQIESLEKIIATTVKVEPSIGPYPTQFPMPSQALTFQQTLPGMPAPTLYAVPAPVFPSPPPIPPHMIGQQMYNPQFKHHH